MKIVERAAQLDLVGLSAEDMNATVWRFMPLAKFMSLVEYRALWFAKLSTLETLEGSIPSVTKARMDAANQRWKRVLPPKAHDQIDRFTTRNEEDGRELTVANCWFLADADELLMWVEYAGSLTEGVAVKSTVRRLVDCVGLPREVSRIGRVNYVTHSTHEMTSYMASQALERAFIKDERFKHEREIRLATMSVKGTHCVRPDGEPYTRAEVQGKDMNNFDSPGLYIRVNLRELVRSIVVSPKAEDWFLHLVKKIARTYVLDADVTRSTAES